MSYDYGFPITFPEQSSIENNSIQTNTTTTSSYTNRKSKVWDYFSMPYGIPNSKTKCHECGKEFSYSGSPSSLKYHLAHKHNIDIFTNNSNSSNQHKKSSSNNNRKTKCYECKKEFSYSGSPSSLKYHLTHKHNIDISQIK
ncbi:2899_t:CDS:2 [Diversispora eburnea]|uniref:2899_t:CDS:1 n=1 Tax=Diversispora eburnea TaxID=1213867 RepID=A0A9N9AA59_9GLOM|nr:2899_t:CDS:2 [Diversispora eburnea]